MVGFVAKDDILSVRIPTELNERLKDCASEKNMTVSFLVLSMIREAETSLRLHPVMLFCLKMNRTQAWKMALFCSFPLKGEGLAR